MNLFALPISELFKQTEILDHIHFSYLFNSSVHSVVSAARLKVHTVVSGEEVKIRRGRSSLADFVLCLNQLSVSMTERATQLHGVLRCLYVADPATLNLVFL